MISARCDIFAAPVHRLEQIKRPIQSSSARSGRRSVAVADRKQREAAAFENEKTAEGFASAAADTVTSLGALALHRYADRVVDRSNHHAVNVLAVFPVLLGYVTAYADPGSITVRQGTAEAGSVAAVTCYRLRT